MTTTLLTAAAAGVITIAGVLLAVAGSRRTTTPPPTLGVLGRLRARTGRGTSGSSWSRYRWPVAMTAGLVGWAVTGWPVVGAIVAATVIGLPVLLGTAKVEQARIARVQAVEEWTRRLADVLVVGIGLEQAIAVTVRTCPGPIQAEVGALAARLAARWDTETALRAFADDLGDASGDLVAAALVLASRRRGPGLAGVLTAVADSVAEDVAMRRKVEAERAKPRTTARALTLLTLGVVAVGSLNTAYLAPYATPLGQLALAGIAGAFIGALAWMRALTLTEPGPRFLTEAGGLTKTAGDTARRTWFTRTTPRGEVSVP